jgi:hypothetical protein
MESVMKMDVTLVSCMSCSVLLEGFQYFVVRLNLQAMGYALIGTELKTLFEFS